jgi:hypothetical protein
MLTREFFGRPVIMLNTIEALLGGYSHLIYPIPNAMVTARLNTITDEISRFILVNEAVGALPLRLQEAIIAHEVGHIELGHLGRAAFEQVREKRNATLVSRAYELEADQYAANMGYTAELLCVLAFTSQFVKPDELLKERIEVLSRQIPEGAEVPIIRVVRKEVHNELQDK